MQPGKKTLIAVLFAFFCASTAPKIAAQDLKTVLARLDATAANFRSTTANFEFDSTQTDPVPNTDVQKGVVYYDRKNGAMRMGIHINEDNGKPVPKVIVVAGGEFQLYEKLIDQVTRSKKAGKYEGYLQLGFGASGKDLEQKFNVKYGGEETVNGVKTDKLELVARDPDILKLFPKITIWIDPARGISVKQFFDEGEGQSRTATYSNIKLNQSLPSDAFTFKTDRKTQYMNR
ncbi:MAG: outer-membrane lipoprotein carrier protein LolA [Terracidiphilus sp.]